MPAQIDASAMGGPGGGLSGLSLGGQMGFPHQMRVAGHSTVGRFQHPRQRAGAHKGARRHSVKRKRV